MNPKQKIIFEDIPKNYELMKNQIIDKKIKMIYSKFIFKYLDLNKLTENVIEIESQLLDYFKDVKFITYHSNTIKQNNDESKFKLSKEKSNTIICIEDECLIIEGEISIITEIIQKMQETKSIINLTFSYEKEDIKEEIDSFISHYQSETKNEFFRMTIKSICGFLIRRFFYPTEYFKNPLFFVFNQPNKLKEKTLKSKLTKEIFSSRNDKTKIDLMKTINEIKFLNFNHCEINDKKFNKNDFIVLRALFSSGRATFYLVIHIETLYLFVMKIFSEFEQDSIEFQREEKFCEQFSHRCFVQFYGFLKEGNKRIGFIYEFMSNNSLNFLFKSYSIEFSSRYNNSRAYLYLGFIYFSRFKNDFITGKKYFEFSSQLNNLEADFFLGYIYSNETFFDEDIKKAIQYYSKCIESKKIIIKDLNSEIVEGYNNYYYHSHNDLGLLYIIYFNDIQNGTKHIKESAFGEYPYGQNNFGLLCEFYLDQIENAIYMYEKASKNHFALSEFNLGFLLERKGKNEEAIEYYIKASDDENKSLIFHNKRHGDLRLEISKKIIFIFLNLKLFVYFIIHEKFDEAKKYFNRSLLISSFSKNFNLNYPFNFEFILNNEWRNKFSYIKKYILLFPLFNLSNQPHLNLNYNFIDQNVNNNTQDKLVFNDPNELFDFVTNNTLYLNNLVDEINSIIEIMKEIIYTKPYNILFGRIFICKKNQNSEKSYNNEVKKNINKFFYEGFIN